MPQRSNANRGAASGGASATPVTSTSEPGALLRFEGVRENSRVRFYVRKADEALAEIGYTEHGERHVGLVAHIGYNILKRLGYPEREAELAISSVSRTPRSAP